MNISIGKKAISAIIATALAFGAAAMPLSSASASPQADYIEHYYSFKDPAIGEVHWMYSVGALSFSARHVIIGTNDKGQRLYKFGTWEKPGIRSTAGYMNFGYKHDESRGHFQHI